MSDSNISREIERKTKMITFVCQVAVIFVVMTASLVNLSIDKERESLWFALLGTSLGVVLPQPRLPSQSSPSRLPY